MSEIRLEGIAPSVLHFGDGRKALGVRVDAEQRKISRRPYDPERLPKIYAGMLNTAIETRPRCGAALPEGAM